MAGMVQKIDLGSQAFARDPFPIYARLRAAGPVFRTRLPLLGKAWMTFQVTHRVRLTRTPGGQEANDA